MNEQRLRWKLLLACTIGFLLWCALMATWQWYYERSLTLYPERQEAYEAKLNSAGRPVFGPWSQVAPFNGSLEIEQEPERNPDARANYQLWKGSSAGWKPMPEYIDGYANALKIDDIDAEILKLEPTVCLARSIVSPSDRDCTVYLGCDGGFTLWLNGELLLFSDTVAEFAAGQETALLPLRAGENRLVLRVKLRYLPSRFFFMPELGEQLSDEILATLEQKFPTGREILGDYRRQSSIRATQREEDFYRLTELPMPAGAFIEGGGLEFDDRGRLLVSTRRGLVYVVENPEAADPSVMRFSRFAAGLHEGFGLKIVNNQVYVVQRGQLTRLLDTDHDGTADRFENVSNDWGLTGNYHEYAYGLETDDEGYFFVPLNASSQHRALDERGLDAPNRGCVMRISATGEAEVFATGFRSPNGIGKNAIGDLFVTDNQGQWVPACPLYHLRRDHFYGHPASKRWAESDAAKARADAAPTPPAVWFPYDEFSESATDIVCDLTGGQFGPFSDQLFIGEMLKGTILRVALEKVAGEYQGACFVFRRGCGAVNRLAFGSTGKLFLTRANRGWGGGGRGDGLARLEFTGRIPMEILSVKLQSDGFAIQFTKPLATEVELTAKDIQIEQFGFHYWATYGSPKIDREILRVDSIDLNSDRREIRLKLDGLKTERVCRISLPHLLSADGDHLLHVDAFYTINNLVR